MDSVLDELDAQETHLRRLARRIDQLKGSSGTIELKITHDLQDRLEGVAKT